MNIVEIISRAVPKSSQILPSPLPCPHPLVPVLTLVIASYSTLSFNSYYISYFILFYFILFYFALFYIILLFVVLLFYFQVLSYPITLLVHFSPFHMLPSLMCHYFHYPYKLYFPCIFNIYLFFRYPNLLYFNLMLYIYLFYTHMPSMYANVPTPGFP